MASRAGSTGIDASLYRREGQWCTALVDVSLGTTSAQEAVDSLPGQVGKLLGSQQASDADIEALTAALVSAEGHASPVARFVAVNNGEVVVDEIIDGLKVEFADVDCGPFPNLVALARARGGQFPYLVAEAGKDGGEVSLYHSSVKGADESRGVTGDPDEAHHARKVPGQYDEPKNQSNTEEIWRRNADELAKQIDELARENYVRLIVLAGDVKAREMVAGMLAVAHKPITSILDQHTRTGGADQAAFAAAVQERVDEVLGRDVQELSERVANRSGSGRPELALGFDEVVAALQQAQAATVLVNQYQDDETLTALNAEPWLCGEDSGDHAESVMGSWPAPEVLLRATALTDASIRYVPDGVLPEGTGIAALLRWPNASESAS
ncbi:hypothetical protein ACIGB6_16145 [Paeniglutamicibacter gangotriensis]|uniref:Peptide chain release factor 1 n=1 Tax=Paeniglutamicibacter gangotriensis Lz1y TaxID=1276920 RepID=M7N9J4_9MICC|nr:hypothetical protein [Paeniglutamicibacter gangotriensis]EMQ98459.1 hypothetical protein ADIAG_01887 [Paeniglutamicibacter gangotriensis Lz1y]